MTHSNTNSSRGGQTYNAPSVEVLDLQVEGILCDSDGYHLGGGGAYGDGDINDNGEY